MSGVAAAFDKPLQPELERPAEEERAFATEFETRYLANAQSQIKSEAVRQFLTVPDGDVSVSVVPRTHRTTLSPVPVREMSLEPPAGLIGSLG
jgi:hypothetical protein